MTLQTPQEWVFNWLGLLCALLGPAYLLSRRWGWRGALLGLGAAPVLVCSWLAAECIVSYRSGAVRVPNLVDPYSTQLHPGSYHPDLRVPVSAERGLRAQVHTATYRLLRQFLGPLPGAYAGPYPSLEAAHLALSQHGNNIRLGEIFGVVALNGATIHVGNFGVLPPGASHPYRKDAPAVIAPLGNHGLLLLLPVDSSRCSIFLYDESVGWFAQYWRLMCPAELAAPI
jgi:hypothetical protein